MAYRDCSTFHHSLYRGKRPLLRTTRPFLIHRPRCLRLLPCQCALGQPTHVRLVPMDWVAQILRFSVDTTEFQSAQPAASLVFEVHLSILPVHCRFKVSLIRFPGEYQNLSAGNTEHLRRQSSVMFHHGGGLFLLQAIRYDAGKSSVCHGCG